MIDFTDCKVLKKSYGGANGNKICIVYNGENYMLKFPSLPTKKTDLSYANGCVSEHISCSIYKELGIPVQETILGKYSKNGKEKIVVACKDFTSVGIVLQDFGSIKNQVIDSASHGYGTELSDIMESIEKQENLDPLVIKKRFWAMFVVDALLGNFDRHNGNWGFLYNQAIDELSLAPVYDCGSCLYPQADKTTVELILNNVGERHSRVFNFPTSAIKQNGKKISYYNYLNSDDLDDVCKEMLFQIYERLDMTKLHEIIDNVEGIDDIQKEFYKVMLSERYELILTPAYIKQKALLHEEEVEYDKER